MCHTTIHPHPLSHTYSPNMSTAVTEMMMARAKGTSVSRNSGSDSMAAALDN